MSGMNNHIHNEEIRTVIQSDFSVS